MTEKTALNEAHRALGARMVDFGGWDMPLAYGSQIDEHHAVRKSAGMFDVSHMCVVDLAGERVREFLRRLVANNVDKLKASGKALYTCMLNPDGGVIDDLIVYFIDERHFRLVVNAATRAKDLAWIRAQAEPYALAITERRELAMIAVQGPEARAKVHAQLRDGDVAALEKLTRFSAAALGDLFIARTGYTGEDGYEIVLPATAAAGWWQRMLDAGVTPCGLGARDTLRLEAGMNLYGQDMDETTSPFEAALAWTVAMEPATRDFNGRAALAAQLAAGVPRQMVGLVLEDKGVLRHGQKVSSAVGDGEILSGTFSPTLGKSIAFARLPAGELGDLTVDIRGRALKLRQVKAPFVKNGGAAPGV